MMLNGNDIRHNDIRQDISNDTMRHNNNVNIAASHSKATLIPGTANYSISLEKK